MVIIMFWFARSLTFYQVAIAILGKGKGTQKQVIALSDRTAGAWFGNDLERLNRKSQLVYTPCFNDESRSEYLLFSVVKVYAQFYFTRQYNYFGDVLWFINKGTRYELLLRRRKFGRC